MERGFGELGDRLARSGTTAERMAIAIGFFFDSVEPATPHEPGKATYLVQAWAEAGQSSTVREMLVRRREQIGALGQLLLREGIARGELPGWLDVEAVALGYSALLDGLVLQRIEDGPSWRREDAERRAFAVLDLLLGAAAMPERPRTTPPPREPFSFLPVSPGEADIAS